MRKPREALAEQSGQSKRLRVSSNIGENVFSIIPVEALAEQSGQSKRLRVSKYLRNFEYGGKHFLYHSCLGNPIEVVEDYPDFIEAINSGVTLEQLNVLPEIKKEVEQLIELSLVEFSDEPDLIERGIIENDELIETGKLVNMLVLDVSTRCNMGCSYCNVHKTQDKHDINGGLMDFDIAKKSVDEYIKLVIESGKKTASISYFGGEPFLNYKMLKRLMRYVYSLRRIYPQLSIYHGVSTNGTIIDDEILKDLKDLEVRVAISLDGLQLDNDQKRSFSNGKGTFWIVEQNLKKLVKQKIDVEIVTTISEHNAFSIPKFVDFLVDIGIKDLSLKSCAYRDYEDNQRRDVYEAVITGVHYAKKKGIRAREGHGDLDYTRGCQGLGGILCVEPSGDVFACPEGIRIKLGDFDSLSSIPKKSQEYRFVSSRITGNLPDCRGCDVEGLCRGGCAGQSEYNFDDIYKVDKSACESIRRNIKRNLAIRASFD
ncbi:radical SAM protein [Prochlorococcus sp. MIT 1303]|uniref:radical SAM/SPASM domain-containing protein n=1 Tax=Prochlorococcus sp. MIT 1303 TaxID=1723647 RepID=UPI0007B39C26|nr:radical SAM protein [Prochlorococcus sp. MIT 1303]KZR68138.1 Anaerobic sulfatase-maturating enzyme [Prochlorococcus sp. MIT 1303]